jgi:hypothetical protein
MKHLENDNEFEHKFYIHTKIDNLKDLVIAELEK